MKDYKKILEGVMNIINTTEISDIGFANICSYISENCPELKESADERIRKAIICGMTVHKNQGKETFAAIPINDCIAWLEKQSEMDMESYKVAEDEKREFVGDGFIKCYADFQDFKEGETYWLEYVGNDNYNVRSDNLLGKTYHITPCQLYTIFKKMTWLEKQGTPAKLSEEEQNRFAKGVLTSCAMSFIDYLDAHKYEGKMCVSNGECEDIENAFHNAMWDKLHRYYGKYIEKQGKQKQDPCEHCNDKLLNCHNFPCIKKKAFEQGKSTLEVIKEEKVDNANKVEPKFKVGYWVVNESRDIWHIDSFDKKNYQVSNGNEYNYFPISKQNEMHLWNIADAKPGDVLFHSDSASNGIFIFKELLKCGFSEEVICYCDYDSEDGFCLGDHHTCCWADAKILHPATEEQIKLLFAKMKEADYEWDAEKKELKKIEDELITDAEIPFGAKDSELEEVFYSIPNGFHAEIEDNKVVIKKGEQKPWSEEDEKYFKNVIDELVCLRNRNDRKYDYSEMTRLINWFKFLKDRVQPQVYKAINEHYELEEFAKIVRCNLTGISKAVQNLFEAKYLQLTGNKMYEGFKD